MLGEASQECALDPRSIDATVGGVLAVGLSGHRRLRYGPLRDRVLEVRFVTADGRLVKGGGPTVKNVSGFDIPRLLVGSFGTIGVLVQVILRCQPTPEVVEWSATDTDPFEVRRRTYRPSCIAWDGEHTHVLVEGVAADVETERRAAGAEPVASAPALPLDRTAAGSRSRPHASATLAPALGDAGVRWLAEIGVGTVHVAADTVAALAAARRAAEGRGGWLLREAGAPGFDGFGRPFPNLAVMERIRAAFDPSGKLSPGRLPLEPEGQVILILWFRSTVRLRMSDAPVEVEHRKTRRFVLDVDENELVACVACGLCLPHCPTYRVTGLEAASPRGRIAAMRAVELDGAPVDDAFRRTMETCVQCRGCEVACPSGVPFGHLMEGARESLAHSRSAPRDTLAPSRRVARICRRAAPALAPARAHVARVVRAAPPPRPQALRPAEALVALAPHAPHRRRTSGRVPVHRAA